MMNVKGTRNRISGTGVGKKLWDFQRQFAFSHQCFDKFCIVILAQQLVVPGYFHHWVQYFRIYCYCFGHCESHNDALP